MGKAVTNVDLIRDVPKVKGLECPPSVPAEPVSGSTVEGKDNLHRDNAGSWAFVDNNISTHLIRNAFGGADTMHLRQLLSIPAPHSRSYRDDVTCTVVFWEEGKENEAQTAHVPAPNSTEGIKAKL